MKTPQKRGSVLMDYQQKQPLSHQVGVVVTITTIQVYWVKNKAVIVYRLFIDSAVCILMIVFDS